MKAQSLYILKFAAANAVRRLYYYRNAIYFQNLKKEIQK